MFPVVDAFNPLPVLYVYGQFDCDVVVDEVPAHPVVKFLLGLFHTF